jgi:hypothetical protein
MTDAVGDQEERHAAALQRRYLIRFDEDRTFSRPGPAPAAGIACTEQGAGAVPVRSLVAARQMAPAAAAVISARGQPAILAIFRW